MIVAVVHTGGQRSHVMSLSGEILGARIIHLLPHDLGGVQQARSAVLVGGIPPRLADTVNIAIIIVFATWHGFFLLIAD